MYAAAVDREQAFQSTHPRGVRLHDDKRPPCILHISIHAPTWGATVTSAVGSPPAIFQSTHPRGVRHQPTGILNTTGIDFNPRTHVGCDTARPPRNTWTSNFNPRTHVGCDPGLSTDLAAAVEFQSTHPRGVRQQDTIGLNFNPKFQSTHPRGVRLLNKRELTISQGFQSTHPRGVRRTGSGNQPTGILFQSTHPRGVRQATLSRSFLRTSISIHAPTWGATRYFHWPKDRKYKFQSTHPRGVRLLVRFLCVKETGFQSTHPRGVRRIDT